MRGTSVRLVDVSGDVLDRSMTGLRKRFDRLVEKGKIDQADAEAQFARITPSTAFVDLQSIELVEVIAGDRSSRAAVGFSYSAAESWGRTLIGAGLFRCGAAFPVATTFWLH